MKLTRRDFLKGGAITALALAMGVKPKMVAAENISIMFEAEVAETGIITLGDLEAMVWSFEPPYHPNCLCVNQERLSDILAYMEADQCYKSPSGTLFGYPIIWTSRHYGPPRATEDAI